MNLDTAVWLGEYQIYERPRGIRGAISTLGCLVAPEWRKKYMSIFRLKRNKLQYIGHRLFLFTFFPKERTESRVIHDRPVALVLAFPAEVLLSPSILYLSLLNVKSIKTYLPVSSLSDYALLWLIL